MSRVFDPTANSLPDLLSQVQMDELARMLDFVLDQGYGKVEIRIVKGLIRFISVSVESDYPRDTQTTMLKSE